MAGRCSLVIALSAIAFGAADSVRDLNLNNFSYPFVEKYAIPSTVHWMPIAGKGSVVLKNGSHAFISGGCLDTPSGCPLLKLDSIHYGELDGMPLTSAVVVMTFHTGGTATWRYVYIVGGIAGAPKVMAWLEAGSRADEGLRDVSIDRGDLKVTVNDPAKRQGDCCSSGTITTRYRWQDGSFHQLGQPILSDDPR